MNAASAATIAVLQIDVDVGVDPGTGLLSGGAGAFVTTLVVGAILVAIAEDFTLDRMAAVLDDPVSTFLYGLAVFLLMILAAFVFAITIVGIVVAVPLLFLVYVLWAFGSTIAFLAIADRLVGRDDGWLKPIVVAAGINGLLTITGVGGIVAFVVGAAGFGAILEGQL